MQRSPIRQKLVRMTGLFGVLLAASAVLAGALEDGQALQRAGKFKEALAHFESAVSADATDAAAARGLSEVLAGLGRYDEAVKAASAGLKSHKEDVALLVARARAYMLIAERQATEGVDGGVIVGTVADADFSLKAALRIDPKNPDARVLKARVYQHQGGAASGETRTELEAVLADFPDHFDANWALARYHFSQGGAKQKDAAAAAPHWKKAEEHFRKCTEIDSESGQAHWQLANAMAWQKGQDASAIATEYAHAAERLAWNDKVLSQLYRWSGGNKAKRVAMFEAVVAKRPGEAAPVTFLAWAQHEVNPKGAAVKTLKAAEKAMPGQPALAFERGQIEMARGKTDAAFDAYLTAIDAATEFRQSIYLQINDKAFRGKGFTPKQREKLWDVLWTKWPQRFEVPNAAGFWYRDVGKDPKKSAAWYPRAVEANPNSAQVLNDTALIFDQYLGEFEMAEPYYRRALAAAEEQGNDYRGRGFDDIGYRDALNNFGGMLSKQERWKDLLQFCEDHVPEDHGQRERWMKAAKKGGA